MQADRTLADFTEWQVRVRERAAELGVYDDPHMISEAQNRGKVKVKGAGLVQLDGSVWDPNEVPGLGKDLSATDRLFAGGKLNEQVRCGFFSLVQPFFICLLLHVTLKPSVLCCCVVVSE